jgi:serine/threonine protein kinase
MTAPTTYCDECGASNPLQATYCFACHTALQPPAPSPLLPVHTANAAMLRETRGGLLPPSYLLHARYSIVSQVGTGGFGAVYQAQDTLFSHRLVAIKEMSQDGLSPRELAEATAAFEREALVLTNLTHPNLPRIHDHFSEHGRSYVVMDFIAGGTLEDSLDTSQRSFPVEVVLTIGLQLAEALDYLHSQQPPIIFRDLKPANIMRTTDNHVYLIDFGIARHFKPGKVKDTIPLGSKGYAAPEQYGKAQTTPQSDIYGLGATLHQLLTSDDPSLTLFHFAPLRLYSSPISAPLNALLQQMLEMEMDKRPARMTVVKQELQRLLAPQTAQKPSPVVKRRTFVKGCLGVVATCSASIAIATFVVKNPNLVDLLFAHPFSGTTPVPSPSPPAPAQATILSRPLYTYRSHAGSVTAVTWSPSGKHIAFAGTLDGFVQVWDAPTVFFPDPTHIERDRFAVKDQRVDALAWSPDGSSIAAVSNNLTGSGTRIHYVQVRSATTGKLSLTYKGHIQAVLTLAWSPDGRQIASGSADGTVRVWDAATGRLFFTYRGHAGSVHTVTWQRGTLLLPWYEARIASGGADATVQVWSVGEADAAVQRWPVGRAGNAHYPQAMALQGELLIYRGHSGPVTSVTWSPDGQLIASGSEDGTVQVWRAI